MLAKFADHFSRGRVPQMNFSIVAGRRKPFAVWAEYDRADPIGVRSQLMRECAVVNVPKIDGVIVAAGGHLRSGRIDGDRGDYRRCLLRFRRLHRFDAERISLLGAAGIIRWQVGS